MVTNLNKDAVFTKEIGDLDPAASIELLDGFIVEQEGVVRRASLAQIQQAFTGTASADAHANSTNNPHSVTAAQVGAFTTQQTTAAINAASQVSADNLANHEGAPNPHGTTADDVGAYTKTEVDNLLSSNSSGGVQQNLDDHINNVSNPHNTSASQVGRDTAQWNANRIQNRAVVFQSTATGATLVYDNDTSTFNVQLVDVAATLPHPVGSAIHLPYPIPGDALYEDESGWLWYPSTGRSLGSTSSIAAFKGTSVFKLFEKLWINADAVAGWFLQNTSEINVSKGASAQADWDANRRLVIPSFNSRVVMAAGGGTNLTTRSVGEIGGSEQETIDPNNLPRIPFRRNDGSSNPGTPLSITANDNKGGYQGGNNDVINADTDNDPISHIQPYGAFSQLWFTGEKA